LENMKVFIFLVTRLKMYNPGGGRFYDCDDEHAKWHPGINGS